VLHCIARGGMATVWAARQHGARGFNRLVALKTVLPELAAPDLDTMFLDEARVTARIHHPNVCEVFELIEHQGVLALSMEWVDGDTLNNILSGQPKDPALDPRVAAQIMGHVACGLHAAHELGDERGAPLQLVHRDVSPQNILISRNGHVKVTDFGVAKALGGVRESTAVGKVKGKLSYMSPEQAQGKLLDRRSDIFSLGVVLYVATVGSHPFRRAGESRHQQLSRLVMNRIKPPSELVPDYPPELEAILMRALERDPDQRYGTADEMARALFDWVLATGPSVTEHHIARLVLDRAGALILERSERIANLMCKSRELTPSEEPVPAVDPTLVPTTSRAGHTLSPGRASARATLRVVSTTLTAAAIGLAASIVFSSPESGPSSVFVRPGAEPAAAAAAPAPTPMPLPAAPGPPSPAVVAAPEPPPAPAADVKPTPAATPAARTSKTSKATAAARRKARKSIDTTSLKRSR
jgi:eukaryotic-like serine/threonine-protein kinase